MKSALEFFYLFYLRLFVALFNAKEERKVRNTLYSNPYFKNADTLLKKIYHRLNPYTICKQFLLQRGDSEVHTYGETPLTELASFLQKCSIGKEDHFIDLGCGRGRVALFVNSYFPCSVTAIDCVPRFINLAKSIESRTNFICQNMLDSDLSSATHIYFYALYLSDEEFHQMIKRFSLLKEGTKIITASFALEEYSDNFTTLFSQKAQFPWGKTELFLNSRLA